MPKIPFVGPSYVSRSLAAAASEMTNLYVEIVEDAADQSKNVANLFLIPGRHALVTLNAHAGDVRGYWSGGGRLFVCVGTYVYEISSAGAIVGTPDNLVFNDTLPVQFFGNGNQLGLVANGFFYLNNGSGFQAARFLEEGVVTIVGTAVSWVSGNQFPAVYPTVMIISGQPVAVASRNTATSITLSVAWPGSGSGTCRTYQQSVFWATGTSLFTQAMEGLPITINGVDYTVKAVPPENSGYILTLIDTDDAGQQIGVAWSAIQANLVYSAASGDLVTAKTGAYLDGSFYVQRPSGGTPDLGLQVNFSDPFDGTMWRGINFKLKEGAPDYIRGILVDAEILYVLGTETAEAWANDKSTGRPERIDGAMQKYGAISAWGMAAIDSKVYFIGGDAQGGPVAYRIDGFTPTRISTHAQEEAWKAAGLGANCVMFTYMEDGHTFVVINFGTETWAWDQTSKTWGKRCSWDGAAFTAYPTKFHTYIPEWNNGEHITGGGDNKVYISSNLFYDDNGADMAWRRAVPYRYNAGNQLFFGRMTLEMETGTVPSGAAPNITRDYSDDRGKTFINPQTAGIGTHDQNSIRVFWPCGGSSRGRVWRFFGSGQYKVALIDLECEETQGTV